METSREWQHRSYRERDRSTDHNRDREQRYEHDSSESDHGSIEQDVVECNRYSKHMVRKGARMKNTQANLLCKSPQHRSTGKPTMGNPQELHTSRIRSEVRSNQAYHRQAAHDKG